MQVQPIGIVHSAFKECQGMPVQPTRACGAVGTVRLFDEFVAGLKDLAGFERIWLLYWLHRARPAQMSVTPFLDKLPHGLFATRTPARPNPIGLSHVRLWEVKGATLHVSDLDICDGTPLLDIKPYVPQFDCVAVTRCGWLDTAAPTTGVADGRFEQIGVKNI